MLLRPTFLTHMNAFASYFPDSYECSYVLLSRSTKPVVSVKISVRWRVIRLAFSLVNFHLEFSLNKGKMNAYYFRRAKTAVLGAIKAELPFS